MVVPDILLPMQVALPYHTLSGYKTALAISGLKSVYTAEPTV